MGLLISGVQVASALTLKSSFCKSMLLDVKSLDASGFKLFKRYSKDYELARKSGSVEANLLQTRSLLELYENDRSVFLRALESKKCFTKTEIMNLEGSLANAEADAISVKSWIDALIGIPGKKFYSGYVELPKFLAEPSPWNFCDKKGAKSKSLTCKSHKGKLRWVDNSYNASEPGEASWPTDFIDGYVNMIEARKRIAKYFEENSVVAGANGAASVEFMKRTSYPGLFQFDTEPKLSACKDFQDLQDKAGAFRIKFVVSLDAVKPDPDWVISDGSRGELIVNRKFKGQVFSVPVRTEISQGDWSDPGSISYRHVTIIDGSVYRFSAC
jgi:hypothetical protein